MALHVLLADPNKTWSETCAKFLESSLYQVSTVENGKDAQVKLTKSSFFSVIMNIELQDYSCMQVLKFVKTRQLANKIIIIASNSKYMENNGISVDDLYKFGATEVITKDVSKEELKAILEGHQGLKDFFSSLPKREGQSQEEEMALSDDKFTAININEFYASKEMLFDIYIKLGTTKYLKILHAGDSFRQERIDKYKNQKGIKHLFIANEDRKKFIHWQNLVAKSLITNQKIDATTKNTALKLVGEKLVEEIYLEGIRPQILDQGKEFCKSLNQMVEKEKDLYKLLRNFQAEDPDAYTHSYLISLFAAATVKQFDWQSALTIETIGIAAMFHDIGKIKLPKELISMKASQMNEQQLFEYQKHPQYSVDILENNRLIPQAVKQIILQHHETSNGTGFPFGLRDSQVTILSKIIFFINEFVDHITEKKVTPVVGVRDILTNAELSGRYNPHVLENFLNTMVDPEKLRKDTFLPSNSAVVSSVKK